MIDQAPFAIERGTRDTLTATVRDPQGLVIDVAVVWRNTNQHIVGFERGGVLVARDTGNTIVSATSLGVSSPGVQVRVVWMGPSKIDTLPWTRSSALNPGSSLTDSVRVRVTNNNGAPVPNSRVRFAVTVGGGSISPESPTTNTNGIAAARWTLGPAVGTNTITASVVRADGSPDPLVLENVATFSMTAYNALTIQGGDDQTAQILGNLPIQPSVRLVDSLGTPRSGVPVVFTAHANGRVAVPVVSTDANGVASPGIWTLGDIPGEQLLDAKVDDATVTFSATGTGAPIHYKPSLVVAGGYGTCALEGGGSVKCWGESPQNGSGTPASSSTPTAVSGSLVAVSLFGGPSHFCALDATNRASCWGLNALADTTGATPNRSAPTSVETDTTWSILSPGSAYNCGISASQGTLCWGENRSGQLGDNTVVPRFTIRPVPGGFLFNKISSGFGHTCALASGSAFCWGANQFGQVGDATTQTRTSPTAVSGGHTFLSINTGEAFTCGLNQQGRAYCWGLIAGAVLPTPTTYSAVPNFTALVVGGGHACALATGGEVYCWGINAWGQLGDGSATTRAVPTRVAGPLRFQQLSAGLEHTCGLTTDGAVACWGRNRGGELGDNASAFRSTPKHIVIGVVP